MYVGILSALVVLMWAVVLVPRKPLTWEYARGCGPTPAHAAQPSGEAILFGEIVRSWLDNTENWWISEEIVETHTYSWGI